MKKYLNPKVLPGYTLVFCLLAAAARLWLVGGGVDEKGLYIAGHPAGILSMALIPVYLLVLYLCCRPLGGSVPMGSAMPSKTAAILGLAAGLCQLCYALSLPVSRGGVLGLFHWVLGIGCAVCFLLLAGCRFRGKPVHYLVYVVLTVYFLVYLLKQYRQWSAEPQLLAYFFQLLATVTLMLFAYQCACRQTGKTSRSFIFLRHSAVFFCMAALDGGLFLYSVLPWLLMEQPKNCGESKPYEAA